MVGRPLDSEAPSAVAEAALEEDELPELIDALLKMSQLEHKFAQLAVVNTQLSGHHAPAAKVHPCLV